MTKLRIAEGGEWYMNSKWEALGNVSWDNRLRSANWYLQ